MSRSTHALQPRIAALSAILAFHLFMSQALLGQVGSEPESVVATDDDDQILMGVVTDKDGNPLADVLVDAWTWVPNTETRTDAKGAFRLDPESGDGEAVELRFSKDGYSPHYIVQQKPGAKDIDIRLDSTTYVQGRVLDLAGNPVPNATIVGQQGPKRGDGVVISSVSTTTKTDEQGKYRMYVFPDTYEMQVTVPNVGAARVPGIVVEPGTAKSQDIQLEEAVQFLAIVKHAVTNEPVQGIVLWNWLSKGVVGISNEKGEITIDGMLPGEFEFAVGEAPMRKYRGMEIYMPRDFVRWWSPQATKEHQREEKQKTRFQRNLDDLTIALKVGMKPIEVFVEPGVTFEGTVYDPNGKPVAGATVAPAKTGSGNSLTGDTRYSEKTKEDGSYRVVMPAGKHFHYNLMVHDGDYREWRNWANGVTPPFESQPGQVFKDFDLKLTRPCVVKGRIKPRGNEEVGGIKVRAHAVNKRGNRYYDPTSATTKKDGTFELRFVRPGKHYIQTEPFWLSAEEAPSDSTQLIDLKPGETREGIEFLHRVIPPPRPGGDVILRQ